MKKLFEKTPITRILLIFYILLFVVLVVVRFTENSYRQNTSATVDDLMTTSARRQELLINIMKSNDYFRVNELNMLYNPDKVKQRRAAHRIVGEGIKNDANLTAYSHLINDDEEKKLFNDILNAERNVSVKRNQLLKLLKTGKSDEAKLFDDQQLEPDYEAFELINARLAEYVNERDKQGISRLNSRLAGNIQATRLMTLVIGVLLTGLGIIIIFVVKTIVRKKNMLAASQKKYRTFIEQTHEVIGSHDAQGRITFINPKFKELLGYSDGELIGRKVTDFLDPSSREDAIKNLEQQSGDGITRNIKRTVKNKDGRLFQIQGDIVWEFNDGKFAGGTGFFKDITEQNNLQKSLSESEDKFRKLFNMAPIPMFTFDPETKYFLQANQAAINYYGYDEATFLQMNIMDIRPADDHPKTTRVIDLIIQEGQHYNGHHKHLKKDGSVSDVEIFASRIVLANRPVVLSIVVDSTERRQVDNKITQAIIKTQEEERYEIGSELHDNVCQLLASAKMSMGSMKNDLPDTLESSYNQSLESIVLATEEIRNLSHRLAPVFFKNTSLKEAFSRLLQTFDLTHSFDISLYYDPAIEEYPMSKDLQLNLYRILQEALRNVSKYAKASEVKVDILRRKNQLHMLIADDGIGFNINAAPSGIGLANMKRRVEFFCGKMVVYSAPGNGCEIMVTIPLDRDIADGAAAIQTA